MVSAVRLVFPAGDHGAVLPEQADAVLHGLLSRAGDTVLAQVIGFPVQGQPIGGQNAVFSEIIAISVNFLPIGDHGAVLGKIIVGLPDLLPAGGHSPRGGVKIIGLSVNDGQAQAENAVAAEIAAAHLQVAPAGLHPVRLIEVIDPALNGLPARNLLSVKILIGVDAVLLYPAAAVHIAVKPDPTGSADHAQPRQNQQDTQHISKLSIHPKSLPCFFFRHFITKEA